MVRILYKWHVETQHLEKFKEVWKVTTNHIHENVKGARGSFMLVNHTQPHEILTIARWDRLEDWKTFWGAQHANEMSKMHELGRRLSIDIYEEIDDYTQ